MWPATPGRWVPTRTSSPRVTAVETCSTRRHSWRMRARPGPRPRLDLPGRLPTFPSPRTSVTQPRSTPLSATGLDGVFTDQPDLAVAARARSSRYRRSGCSRSAVPRAGYSSPQPALPTSSSRCARTASTRCAASRLRLGAVQLGEAGLRSVHHRQRHGPVQRDHRARRVSAEQPYRPGSAASRCPRRRAPRRAPRRSRPGAGTGRPAPASASADQRDALGDLPPVPPARGPARRAGPARRPARCGPAGGRR